MTFSLQIGCDIFADIRQFGEFIKNIDKIDHIILVDNSMLWVIDKYKFSSYEFMGDLIYKIIINDLKINCLIDFDKSLDIYSHNIQEKICNSIKFKKYIQKNNIISYDKKEVSDADYFEVFIYWIYKTSGYETIKNIILDLIKKIIISY